MKFIKQQWHIFFLYIQHTFQRFHDDKITVYAAQASFFVLLSAMPFLSLSIAVISFFTPLDVPSTAPKISLLSLSAIVTLWSASRGTAAIRRGIETVYHSNTSRGYLFHRIKSLISTLSLIFLVVATVVLILFGNLISAFVGKVKFTEVILRWRIPFFMLFICIVLTFVYTSAAKRSAETKSTIFSQLPGAIFASMGWILFSYIYSLYIKFFPNASYIYGSLAAICLIMLWLYFCILILLLGAEFNNLYPTWIKSFKKRKNAVLTSRR